MKLAPFTIVIDQREKHPYEFADVGVIVPVESAFLATGDYSIKGCEPAIAVERKSLEDLYATLGQHRDRFEAEMQRLNEMRFAAILVEATLAEVQAPSTCRADWISQLHPNSVEGTLVAWSVRYPRVHWWCVGSRRAGELRTFRLLEVYWRKFREMPCMRRAGDGNARHVALPEGPRGS